jgi:hypothetical protein
MAAFPTRLKKSHATKTQNPQLFLHRGSFFRRSAREAAKKFGVI